MPGTRKDLPAGTNPAAFGWEFAAYTSPPSGSSTALK